MTRTVKWQTVQHTSSNIACSYFSWVHYYAFWFAELATGYSLKDSLHGSWQTESDEWDRWRMKGWDDNKAMNAELSIMLMKMFI